MKTKINIISILCILCLVCAVNLTYATSYSWKTSGGADTSWKNTNNWNPAGVPSTNDTVTIASDGAGAAHQPYLDTITTVKRLIMTSGTLNLNTFNLTISTTSTFTSGTITNGKIYPNGGTITYSGTTFDCEVNSVAGKILLSGSTFNYVCYFEDTNTLSSIGNHYGTGNNTFNAKVTMKKNSSYQWGFSSSNGNTFNDTALFLNIKGNELLVSQAGSTKFNGIVYVGSTVSGGVQFGGSSSADTLASGKTINIDSNTGFSVGTLQFRNFTQVGSTSQSFTTTGSSTVNFISATWNGAVNFSCSHILLKNSIFNSTATLTQTSTSTGANSDGGNTFNASATISCSGGSQFRLGMTYDDTFNSDLTISGNVNIGAFNTTIVKGNLTAAGSNTHFNSSSGISGTLKFAGSNSQHISSGGTGIIGFNKIKVDKTGGSVTLDTTVTVDDTLTFVNKNIITTSTHYLSILSGSKVAGASNSSFVSGPVKKTGNTAFVFPTGKSNDYRAIEISAPSSATDAYTAEYFDSGQSLGSSKDSTINYLSECNYWNLARNTGSSNVTVKLYWDTLNCGAFQLDSIHIARWNGTKWKDEGNGGLTGNLNKGTIATASAQSSFGNYAIAYNLVPHLDFEFSPDTIISGSPVTFTNKSTGFTPSQKFLWFFDDPNEFYPTLDSVLHDWLYYTDTTTGQLQGINHTYFVRKNYLIKLIIVDTAGNYSYVEKHADISSQCLCNSNACNLVCNSDFSEVDFCIYNPVYLGTQGLFPTWQRWASTCWYTSLNTTPDLWLTSTCVTTLPPITSPAFVPTNAFGCQDDHTVLSANGNEGYGAISTWNSIPNFNWREYLQMELATPLVNGTIYDVSFWANLADGAAWATDVGMFISTTPPVWNPVNGFMFTNTPQISALVANGSFVTSHTAWTQISGTYTAIGGERFITIGNFVDDNTANMTNVGVEDDCNGLVLSHSYYFIDDVSISEAIDVDITESGNYCPGEIVTLDAGTGYSQYEWSTSETTETIDVTVSGTYTVTVTNATGCTASDDIVITFLDAPDPPDLISGDLYSCTDNPVYCVNTVTGITFTWSTSWSGGPSGSGNCTSSLTIPQGTTETITFTATNASGCTSQTVITIYPCCEVPVDADDLSDLTADDVYNNAGSFIYADNTGSDLAFYGSYTSPPNVAGSATAEIVINGKFTIDHATTFSHLRIQLGPDAEIIVNPSLSSASGYSLIFENCYISACDNYMWKHIYLTDNTSSVQIVSSRIEDGQEAVFSNDGGDFNIGHNYFNKNWISIKVEPYAAVHTGEISRSTFECFDNSTNTPGDVCLPPHLAERSYAGIELTDVDQINIGVNYSSTHMNFFNYLDVGIKASGSSFTVINNHFENITLPAVNTHGLVGGIAIHAIKNTASSAQITVGGSGLDEGNEFETCGHGIFARNMDTEISYNKFNNIANSVGNASYCCKIFNCNGRDIDIFENNFDNFGDISTTGSGTAIYLQNVHSSFGVNIYNNYFNLLQAGASGNRAMGLENIGFPPPNVTSIYDNEMQEIRTGIGLSQYDDAFINSINTIVLPDLYNGIGTYIGTGAYYGVRLGNSYITTIDENIIKRDASVIDPDPDADTHIFGVSVETSDVNSVMNNNIRKLGAGVRFMNTGFNDIHCNELYHNRTGVRIAASAIGDQGTPGTPHIAQDNAWDDYGTTYMDIRGILPVFPANWYAQQITPPYLPPIGFVSPAFISFPAADENLDCHVALPRLSDQQLMADMIGEEGDFSSLTDEQKYKFKKGVYAILQKDPTWMFMETEFDDVLREFYEEEASSSIGLLYEAAQNLIIDTSYAQELLGTVTPINSFEENERAVYEIYLETLARDIDSFTDEQYEFLYNLAVQNPADVGIAAYSARVMLEIEVDDFIDDIEARLIQQKLNKGENSKEYIRGRMLPNPTKDMSIYNLYLGNDETGILTIFNVLGEKVMEYKLFPGANQIPVTLEKYYSGLYLFKVKTSIGYSEHGKLILSK